MQQSTTSIHPWSTSTTVTLGIGDLSAGWEAAITGTCPTGPNAGPRIRLRGPSRPPREGRRRTMTTSDRQRPRVLVSTDIGGTDPDDFQSMVHLLLYADVLDLEGLLSSPYGDGRAADIHRVIDCYEHDFDQLCRHARYPQPDALRALVKQGAIDRADHHGRTGTTEGSDWIVQRARAEDERVLDVLVWGGLDDVAQSLHEAPDIADRLRVHYIGGPNTMWSVNAYRYLEAHHPTLAMIESNSTYRGFFEPDPVDPHPLDNEAFVRGHVLGHGEPVV